MEAHVKNYLNHFGLDLGDYIACEVCGSTAVDIHHVEPRSKFGSTKKNLQDDVDNLIALCRECHNKAHGPNGRFYKTKFQSIIADR